MNRFLRSLIFVPIAIATIAPTASFAETNVAIVSSARQAPLDRYFGKLNMSPIGVANAIRHVSERSDANEVDAATAIAGLAAVEDSVKDWEAQFPGDNWLPRTLMSIKRVYHKFDDPSARANEARVAAWLTLRYRDSEEARACLVEADAHDAVIDAAFADRTDPTPRVLKP